MNTKEPPQYLKLVGTLKPVLHDLPGKIIAIDGRPGSGKTTLARYLAWRFNISLAETDLFLIRHTGLTYRKDELDRVIEARLVKPRPIIVEGVAVLQLLEWLNRRPDYTVYVATEEAPRPSYGDHDNPDADLGYVSPLDAALNEYDARYNPRSRADYIITLPDW